MSSSARDREAVAKLGAETQGLRAELDKLKSEVRLALCAVRCALSPVQFC